MAQIEKIIKISLDAKQAERELKKLSSEIDDITKGTETVSIDVEVDMGDAVSSIQELQGELEGLQDVDVSASIDATAESTSNLTIATGEYNSEVQDATKSTENYSNASAANTTANIAQVFSTSQVNNSIIKLSAAKKASALILVKELLLQQKILLQSKKGTVGYINAANKIKVLEGEMRKLTDEQLRFIDSQKDIIKETKKVNKALKEQGETVGQLELEFEDLNEVMEDTTEGTNVLEDASTGWFNSLAAGIPVIGKYIAKLGLAGGILALIGAAFADAGRSMVGMQDGMIKFVSYIGNIYPVIKGILQSILRGGGLSTADNIVAGSRIADILNSMKKIAGLEVTQTKRRVASIKAIADLELQIANSRRIAQDSENDDFKDRYKNLQDLYLLTQQLQNEKLKTAGEELTILRESANLNDTLYDDDLEIQQKLNEIVRIKAETANLLRNLDRINKIIITEFNASIKSSRPKGGGGKPEEDKKQVILPELDPLPPLEDLDIYLETEFEIKKKWTEKTWEMLQRHTAKVKEMDRIVLENKLLLTAEFARVTANVSNALAGYYANEMRALEEKGETESEEYAKLEVLQKRQARAAVINNTAAAIMATWASYMSVPGGVAGAILAGIQTAGLLVTGFTQLKNIDQGSIGGGGAGSPGAAPTYNVIAENEYNPLEGGNIGDVISESLAANPIKTYVVAKDMTSQQEMDRAIESNTTIG